MTKDCQITWDSENWLEKFQNEGADFHSLRHEVWENTLKIVENGNYISPDRNSILIENITPATINTKFFS